MTFNTNFCLAVIVESGGGGAFLVLPLAKVGWDFFFIIPLAKVKKDFSPVQSSQKSSNLQSILNGCHKSPLTFAILQFT